MANEEAWSNVSDFESNNNYDHLLNAFNELHDEAQRLTFINRTLKGKVRCMAYWEIYNSVKRC